VDFLYEFIRDTPQFAIVKDSLTKTTCDSPTFRTPTARCNLIKRHGKKWRKIFTEHGSEINNPWSNEEVS